MQRQVHEWNWIAELGLLSEIATSEPKVAYIFFASGCKCKLTYYMKYHNGLKVWITHVILTDIIPSITGGIRPSNLETKLLSYTKSKTIDLSKSYLF